MKIIFCQYIYSVIIFTEEGRLKDTVTVVPRSWLLADKTQAYWPTFSAGKASQRLRLILSLAEPLTQDWPTKEIKFCHSYKTYKLAQDAAKKQAKQEDTVSTEPHEQGRGQRPKSKTKRPYDTSSDSGSQQESPVKSKRSKKQDKTDKTGKTDKTPKHSTPRANLEVAPNLLKIQSLLKNKTPQRTVKSTPGQNRFTGSQNLTSAITLQASKGDTVNDSPARSLLRKEPVAVGRKPFTPDLKRLPGTSQSNCPMNAGPQIRKVTSPVMSILAQQTPPVVEKMIVSSPEKRSGTDSGEDSNNSDFQDGAFSGDPALDQDNDGGHIDLFSSENQTDSNDTMNLNNGSTPTNGKERLSQNSSKPVPSKSAPAKSSGKKRCTPLSSKLSELKDSRNQETLVVAEILEEMNSKLDIQGMNLAKILQCVDPEEAVIERPQGLPSLPLASESAFETFESFLDVPTHFTGSSLYLSGKLMDQSVPYKGAQKLLRTMISNNLARAISWEGTYGTKIAFNKTKSCEVLLSALLRRFSEKHMGKVKDKIQKWFSNSQGRKVSTTHRSSTIESSGDEDA